MSGRRAVAAALAALTLACGGERPAATPAPAATLERPDLRPLTSRDGVPDPAPGPAQGAPQAGAVSGTLTLSPSLASRAAAAQALFIVARDAGSQQIVAVRKERELRFPFRFTISGADAMTPGTSFTGPFDVTARLSKSGDAIPAAGDVEGQAKGVRAGSRDVAIMLDRVRQ